MLYVPKKMRESIGARWNNILQNWSLSEESNGFYGDIETEYKGECEVLLQCTTEENNSWHEQATTKTRSLVTEFRPDLFIESSKKVFIDSQ